MQLRHVQIGEGRPYSDGNGAASTVFRAIGGPYYDAIAVFTGPASTILKAIGTAMEKRPLPYQYEKILIGKGLDDTMKIEVRMYPLNYVPNEKKAAQDRVKMRIESINEELANPNNAAKPAEKSSRRSGALHDAKNEIVVQEYVNGKNVSTNRYPVNQIMRK